MLPHAASAGFGKNLIHVHLNLFWARRNQELKYAVCYKTLSLNFEFCYASFILRPLQKLFEDEAETPRVQMENNIASPLPLTDILYSIRNMSMYAKTLEFPLEQCSVAIKTATQLCNEGLQSKIN